MNNYEKIKNMTLDEMAEFIKCQDCYYCEARDICNCWRLGEPYENCTKYARQWLQQEVE